MSERFYINWPLAPGPMEMTGPEARHLAIVCRLRAGAELCLFNGDGHEYPSRVVETRKNVVRLDVLDRVSLNRELPFSLEIAAPIPKGDRAHFLVEKLTELGVTTFIPLLCNRGVINPGEGKIEKLERYVIEASKQCGRNVIMEIGAPVLWANYCGSGSPGELRVLAHPSSIATTLDGNSEHLLKIRGAVGPEGGFTEEEIELALSNGWQMINMGPRILRMETAAIFLAMKEILTRATS